MLQTRYIAVKIAKHSDNFKLYFEPPRTILAPPWRRDLRVFNRILWEIWTEDIDIDGGVYLQLHREKRDNQI